MEAKFLFDPDIHEYRVADMVLPSVTQVLKAGGLYKGEDYFAPIGLELGHAIHLACEYYDRKTLDEDGLDSALTGYLAAWKAFLADTGFEAIAIEEPLYSQVHQFAGTPDRFGKMGKDFWIPDIKHGSPQPCFALQTAAYQILVSATQHLFEPVLKEKLYIINRCAVYLEANGKYRMVEHKDRTDSAMFLSLLAVYQYRKRNGLL